MNPIEVPLWLVIMGGIFTLIFGGGGLVLGIIQIFKTPSEIHKTNADINQVVITGSIEVSASLLNQYKSVLEIAERERKEKEDCYGKLETVQKIVKIPDKSID